MGCIGDKPVRQWPGVKQQAGAADAHDFGAAMADANFPAAHQVQLPSALLLAEFVHAAERA